MQIGFVLVFVTDLKRSLDFYTRVLGMELDYSDRTHWAQFKSGEEMSLALQRCDASHTVHGSKVVGRFVGVTFMVDDIAEIHARLSGQGVEFTGKPEKQAWGGTLAYLKDLDGNILTLMQEARPQENR
jgi:catechol 2,3-dioxygenase-like lactoylglutathione lyase family enzyme